MINKKKSIIFVLLILLTILSLGVLSAADNESANTDTTSSEDNTNIETQSTDVKEDVGSFSELDKLLKTEEYAVNLEKDYAYNKATDKKYEDGLNLSMRSLIINGNNHIIDAKNATVFSLYGTYLGLNNLTIKNARKSITGSYSNVSTENVFRGLDYSSFRKHL